MTVSLQDLDLLRQLIKEYGQRTIQPEQTIKRLVADTIIHAHERNQETLSPLDYLEPFGHSNEEPLFVLPNTIIKSVEKVGSKGK